MIKSWARNSAASTTSDKPPDFYKQYGLLQSELMDWLTDGTLESTANWLLFQSKWLNPGTVPKGITPRTVVEVELGVNFAGEYFYAHPCVVLRRQGPVMTVVPLTSQDSGKGIVVTDTAVADRPVDSDPLYQWRVEFVLPGRTIASVALLEQVRTVSVGRALNVWKDGTNDLFVSKLAFNEIRRRLTRLLAPSVLEELNALQEKKNTLLDSLKKTEDRAAELQAQLNAQQQRYDELVAVVARSSASDNLNASGNG